MSDGSEGNVKPPESFNQCLFCDHWKDGICDCIDSQFWGEFTKSTDTCQWFEREEKTI